MTEEDRRRLLVSQLRGRDRDSAPGRDFLCLDAAVEIERLAALAQSDAAELASYKKLVYIIGAEIKRRDQLQAAGEIYTPIQSDAEPVAWRETLVAARNEIISLLPQNWFEDGFLKETSPIIDKIDDVLRSGKP